MKQEITAHFLFCLSRFNSKSLLCIKENQEWFGNVIMKYIYNVENLINKKINKSLYYTEGSGHVTLK